MLSYIDGVVNLKRGVCVCVEGGILSFIRDFMRAISAMFTISTHNSEMVQCINWRKYCVQTDLSVFDTLMAQTMRK